MRGKSIIDGGMLKGGSIVQVQQTGAKRAKQDFIKIGDIVAYMMPKAKVQLISKHKQIRTSNTQHGFI